MVVRDANGCAVGNDSLCGYCCDSVLFYSGHRQGEDI